MTPEQESHLDYIQAKAVLLIEAKYRAGQVRHGGNLFDKTALELCDEAINEAIDQMVYLITLRKKLKHGNLDIPQTNIRPVEHIPTKQDLPPWDN